MRTWLSTHRLFLLLLLVLIALRLPHINRPLSKHHDFNNAVILINAVSWSQAGGAANVGYTPLMNFQGKSNRVLEIGPHIDANGNHVYLSFGAGWYVLPYFVFHFLQITPTPLALEILNIFIGLFTISLLYVLLRQWLANEKQTIQAVALFALLPAPLWYMGHSYVTTGIMLPLVLCVLLLWRKAASTSNALTASFHLQLFVAIVMLMYFDWVAAFLAAGMGVWGLASKKRNNSYVGLFFTAGISAAVGIGLIFYQFAQYLSWQQVVDYWSSRSAYRTIANQDEGWLTMIRHCITHIGSGYNGIVFLLIYISIKQKSIRWLHIPNHWLSWAMIAVLIYNLVLFHWSASHEFAWMAFALVFTMWLFVHKYEWIITVSKTVFFLIVAQGLLQYFLINLPGEKGITGTAYNDQQMKAKKISASIPANATVFVNMQNPKIIEWYSQRTFNYVPTKDAAIRIADSLHLKHVFWIERMETDSMKIQALR